MKRKPRAPAWLLASTFAVTLPWLVTTGCSSDKPPAKGQLMVAFQTDMEIPKDVTSIRIQVTQLGLVRHDASYTLGPDQAKLPATLAIIAGERASDPVTIKLIAYRDSEAHVVQKITTTVPGDRIATLHMPVEWLCWDQVTGSGEDVDDNCGADATCVAGDCKDSHVDSSSLQTYTGKNVFGGASGPGAGGTCLDVLTCFSQGYQTPVDTSDCSVALPSGATDETTNVGLVLPLGNLGICSSSTCMVALTQDSWSGYTIENGRAKLPKSVCTKLAKQDALGVAVTSACPAKTSGIPTCGPWSSVTSLPGSFDAGAPDATLVHTDAGGDAPVDAQPEASEDANDGQVVILPAPELGRTCSSDAECGSLSCIKPSDTTLDGFGVTGGVCTASCDGDATVCGKYKTGSVCVDLNPATNGGKVCLESCTADDAGVQCSGRTDVACLSLKDSATGTMVNTCQPVCSASTNCGTSFCDLGSGLCTPTQPTGDTGTLGTECTGDGGTSTTCEGACKPFVDPGTQQTLVSCSGLCSLGSIGCGWDGASLPGNVACAWAADPNNQTIGAGGFCVELCDCQTTCANPSFQCTEFPQYLKGVYDPKWVGYCSPPSNPDGTPLAGAPC